VRSGIEVGNHPLFSVFSNAPSRRLESVTEDSIRLWLGFGVRFRVEFNRADIAGGASDCVAVQRTLGAALIGVERSAARSDRIDQYAVGQRHEAGGRSAEIARLVPEREFDVFEGIEAGKTAGVVRTCIDIEGDVEFRVSAWNAIAVSDMTDNDAIVNGKLGFTELVDIAQEAQTALVVIDDGGKKQLGLYAVGEDTVGVAVQR